MLCDNIVIHYYPNVDCIAKCNVNLKYGKRIVFQIVLKDPKAAAAWLARNNYCKPTKTIIHW